LQPIANKQAFAGLLFKLNTNLKEYNMWWFFYGILVGLGLMRLIIWVQEGYLTAGWYAWPLIGTTIILIAAAAQHFFASLAELETRAAWMGLMIMGIPALISAGFAIWTFLPV
jgi:hypothetical protein